MAFLIGSTQVAEAELSAVYEEFKLEFDKLLIGSLSLPINLPGTSYYRGFEVVYTMFTLRLYVDSMQVALFLRFLSAG